MTSENHESLDEPTNLGFPFQPGAAPVEGQESASDGEFEPLPEAQEGDNSEKESKPKRKPRKKATKADD